MKLEQVGFYHLEKGSLFDTVPVLVDKIYGLNLSTVIYHTDKTFLEELDRILWTYTPLSFIPHCLEGDAHQEQAKVVLCHSVSPQQMQDTDVLVALSPYETPSLSAKFKRIVDMFEGRDENAVQLARQRWKEYAHADHTCIYWVQNPQGKWQQAKTTN